MPRETAISDTIIAHVCRLPGCWAFKMPGSVRQQTGLPDLFVIRFGRVACLEVKQPGQHPKRKQADMMQRLASIHVCVGTVTSWADARELLIRGAFMTREEERE